MIKIPILSKHLWLGALLCSALCLSQPALSMTDSEREARLEELRSTIDELKQELNNVKNNRSSLLDDLEISETRIGELSQKVKDLKEQLEDKQSHLNQLRSERTALITVKKQQQGSVKQHINAAYRLGQQSSVKLLLNQGDPSALSRNLKYYDYLIKERAQKIQTYVKTIERLNQIEPDMIATVNAIAEKNTSLKAQQQVLLQQQSSRKQTLSKIERKIASKDAKLIALESDRRSLEALLQRVVQVVGDFIMPIAEQPFPKLKGKMPWPAQGKVIKRFGSSRVTNKVRWQGLLISAKEGSPVTSIHHGRVVFSDYLRGHGLLIIVDHGAGYMSLYAHNQALYKELGDWVSAREKIAAVGQSGGRSTSSLYFELRYKGKPKNPKKWLIPA